MEFAAAGQGNAEAQLKQLWQFRDGFFAKDPLQKKAMLQMRVEAVLAAVAHSAVLIFKLTGDFDLVSDPTVFVSMRFCSKLVLSQPFRGSTTGLDALNMSCSMRSSIC